jgi:lantibiotic modifying enzyme
LLNAAEGVGVAASREHSAALMKRVVLRARERGYRLGEHRPEKLLDPSLFQGVSGIGLQLLRCAAPEQVPCVGMWE